jgi:hypothetical protein
MSFELKEQVKSLGVQIGESVSGIGTWLQERVSELGASVAKGGADLWNAVTDTTLLIVEGLAKLFNPSLEDLVNYQMNVARAQAITAVRMSQEAKK